MAISYFPEKLSLELKLNKLKLRDKTPSILTYYPGFDSDLSSVLNLFGLDGIQIHNENENILLSKFEYNGLFLSTMYLRVLNKYSSFILDNLIINNNIISEIPVLYSKITNMEVMDKSSNSFDSYLKDNFEHVYIIETNRKKEENDDILPRTIDTTKLIYESNNHPIQDFKRQLSKTNKIKLELIK